MNRALGVFTGVLVSLVVTGSAWSNSAQQPGSDSRVTDQLGWHIVRPGETLEKITELYLGTPKLWRDNWKLNPDLADPNKLSVGQRLRVILERELPPRTAELTALSNRVEQKPEPEPSIAARVGSLFKERDGLRTYAKSSAKLRLDDDSELLVTEDSLVFLTEMVTTVSGVRRETVEIVEGQAELEARAAPRVRSEIEIVMGDARTRPRPDPAGVSRTRARRPEAGGAAVMVYGGRAEVTSGGASVDVPTGMGTSVPEGGAPAPPEPLLAAPVPIAPGNASAWEFANPAFSWRAVDGAAGYVLELCAERECSELVERVQLANETTWIADALPMGTFFWRVSGVSVSGLDGYPSRAQDLTIRSARVDVHPPVVAALVSGTGFVTESGGIRLGTGGGVTLNWYDDASGVTAVEYQWDDAKWLPYLGEALQPPLAESRSQKLAVRARDALGRESVVWSVDVAVDEQLPEPPAVEVTEPPASR